MEMPIGKISWQEEEESCYLSNHRYTSNIAMPNTVGTPVAKYAFLGRQHAHSQ